MRRTELQDLLRQHGLSPQSRFGQNFLVDPALLRAIPSDAGVQTGERLLEVGPGVGALTEQLLAVGGRVLAVEIDHGLCRALRERFTPALNDGHLRLVEGDVLARNESFHPEVEAWWAEGPAPRLVANLPYQISGPFLGRLPGRPLAGACLLLQREVAEKAAGRAETGPLSVRLALSFHARLGRRLPAEVFWPRPQVDSAFLHLEPRPDAPNRATEAVLADLLRVAYAQRRKVLLPRLRKAYPEGAEALLAAGVDARARPDDVPVADWLGAARAVLAAQS